MALTFNTTLGQENLLEAKYSVDRIQALQPSDDYFENVPTTRQCVGTNRLWGAFLGKALFDDLRGSVSLNDLVDVAILSRTMLVLEDYADDEHIEHVNERDWVLDWMSRVEADLCSIYLRLGEDFNCYKYLRSRSQREVVRRSKGILGPDIFTSSIEKCLIFFNPYRMEIAKRSDRYLDRLKFLEVLFFACQLLDDYQDLGEDRRKKLNNNVYYEMVSSDKHQEIEEQRLSWVSSLLIQVYRNLNRREVCRGALDSRVMSYFHSAANDFIEEMLELVGARNITDSNAKALDYFETWSFDPIGSMSADLFPIEYERFIRPEFMQTYSRGFRTMEEV